MAMGKLPVNAMFAFPLRVGVTGIGTVDLYRERPGRLADDELALASGISSCLTMVILGLRLGDDADDLRRAPTSDRAPVHQATGMLMATSDNSAGQALARLRGHAFEMDRSVDDVAQDLVATRLSPRDLNQ